MLQKQLWRGLVLGAALGYGAVRASRARRRISFAGRCVIVSGGSRGLGLALARMLVKEGAKVGIAARDREELDRAAADLRTLVPGAKVVAVVCDIAHQTEVNQAVEKISNALGPVEVLLNVAGMIQVGPWEHMKTRDFEEAFDVHLWGPLNMMRATIPHMRKRTFGRIVNVASVGGAVAVPHMLPYASSKAALIGLSDGIRSELIQSGIRVTTAIPSLMRTGSHVNARFKGQHGKEFAWFSAADSMPLLSLSAERAARQILEACRYGDYHVAVGWPARVAEIVSALAPNLTARALGSAHSVMPTIAGDSGNESQSGWRARDLDGPRLTCRADEAIEAFNEGPPRAAASKG